MKRLDYYILLSALTLLFFALPEAAFAEELRCTNATPTGTLFDETGCNQLNGVGQIFSRVICEFIHILNAVLGKTYCGIQYSMRMIVPAVLTIYMAVFGIQILTGITKLKASEIMVRLFKIVAVILFTTKSTWAIGVAFNFFVALMLDGISWSISTVLPGANVGDGQEAFFNYMDQLVYMAVLGPFTNQKASVIGFFAVMSYIFPPIFLMIISWLWINFTIMVSALLNFMLGLSAIAFLIALSPIFMSFMLFKATYHFFDSWVKYMISYALQVVIVFACIALWIKVMMLFPDFFTHLTNNIVAPYRHVWVPGAPLADPTDYWGICEHSLTMGQYGPWLNCNSNKIIPASAIPEKGDFIYFVVYWLSALIIVNGAFRELLKNIPSISKQLAGPEYTPLLSGGFGDNSISGLTNKAKSAHAKAVEARRSLNSGSAGPGGASNANFNQRHGSTGAPVWSNKDMAGNFVRNFNRHMENIRKNRPIK